MVEGFPPLAFYRAGSEQPLALLSLEPAASGQFLVRVARGKKRGQLSLGTAYGPYSEAELASRWQEVINSLFQEGFLQTRLAESIAALQDPSSKVRARAALRLGWQGGPECVEPLLQALASAVDDSCSILDALGNLQAQAAVPVLRQYAARKLLSRRRSAVEALRRIGATEGLQEGVPEWMTGDDPVAIAQTVMAQPAKDRGQLLDTLYELDNPAGNEAIRQLLPTLPLERRDLWRYVKSIFKRATLRFDERTLAVANHTIEVYGRSNLGATATVKSGYDGEKRETPIFHRRTQSYLRRAAWRHLRLLASYRPQLYAPAAAWLLSAYDETDGGVPKGDVPAFAECYVFHRILWGASERFRFSPSSLRLHSISGDALEREEAYPALWDSCPQAYLTVLTHARTLTAQRFAYEAITQRHPELLREIDPEPLLGLLDAIYEPTVLLAMAEIERRFDPAHPDWQLLERLAQDERAPLRELSWRWMAQCAPLWSSDLELTLRLLDSSQAETRARVADLCVASAELAPLLWERLKAVEPEPHWRSSWVRLIRETPVLAAALDRLPLKELVDVLGSEAASGRALAGWLLSRRSSALEEIGLDRVLTWAEDEWIAVRQAAQGLLREAEPDVVFPLLESAWADTRELAMQKLSGQASDWFDADRLVGLCDSQHADVREMGQQKVAEKLATLDVEDLIRRLSQNPHRNLRRFALELTAENLGPGAAPLAHVLPLLRAILMDLQPRRADKSKVLAFLVTRGLLDLEQATLAASVLSEVVRSSIRHDAEGALQGLVELQLTYPQLRTPVRLVRS